MNGWNPENLSNYHKDGVKSSSCVQSCGGDGDCNLTATMERGACVDSSVDDEVLTDSIFLLDRIISSVMNVVVDGGCSDGAVLSDSIFLLNRVICGVVNGLHVGEDPCDMACFVRKSAPVSTANYYSVQTDIGDTSALQRDSGMHTDAGGGYTLELGHRDVDASICIVRDKGSAAGHSAGDVRTSIDLRHAGEAVGAIVEMSDGRHNDCVSEYILFLPRLVLMGFMVMGCVHYGLTVGRSTVLSVLAFLIVGVVAVILIPVLACFVHLAAMCDNTRYFASSLSSYPPQLVLEPLTRSKPPDIGIRGAASPRSGSGAERRDSSVSTALQLGVTASRMARGYLVDKYVRERQLSLEMKLDNILQRRSARIIVYHFRILVRTRMSIKCEAAILIQSVFRRYRAQCALHKMLGCDINDGVVEKFSAGQVVWYRHLERAHRERVSIVRHVGLDVYEVELGSGDVMAAQSDKLTRFSDGRDPGAACLWCSSCDSFYTSDKFSSYRRTLSKGASASLVCCMKCDLDKVLRSVKRFDDDSASVSDTTSLGRMRSQFQSASTQKLLALILDKPSHQTFHLVSPVVSNMVMDDDSLSSGPRYGRMCIVDNGSERSIHKHPDIIAAASKVVESYDTIIGADGGTRDVDGIGTVGMDVDAFLIAGASMSLISEGRALSNTGSDVFLNYGRGIVAENMRWGQPGLDGVPTQHRSVLISRVNELGLQEATAEFLSWYLTSPPIPLHIRDDGAEARRILWRKFDAHDSDDVFVGGPTQLEVAVSRMQDRSGATVNGYDPLDATSVSVVARQKVQFNVQEMRDFARSGELPDACGYCGKPDAPMMCNKCLSVAYCGKECQRAHHAVHRDACQITSNIRNDLRESCTTCRQHLSICTSGCVKCYHCGDRSRSGRCDECGQRHYCSIECKKNSSKGRPKSDKLCANCHQPAKFKCTGCTSKLTMYCSKTCQERHFTKHRSHGRCNRVPKTQNVQEADADGGADSPGGADSTVLGPTHQHRIEKSVKPILKQYVSGIRGAYHESGKKTVSFATGTVFHTREFVMNSKSLCSCPHLCCSAVGSQGTILGDRKCFSCDILYGTFTSRVARPSLQHLVHKLTVDPQVFTGDGDRSNHVPVLGTCLIPVLDVSLGASTQHDVDHADLKEPVHRFVIFHE